MTRFKCFSLATSCICIELSTRPSLIGWQISGHCEERIEVRRLTPLLADINRKIAPAKMVVPSSLFFWFSPVVHDARHANHRYQITVFYPRKVPTFPTGKIAVVCLNLFFDLVKRFQRAFSYTALFRRSISGFLAAVSSTHYRCRMKET